MRMKTKQSVNTAASLRDGRGETRQGGSWDTPGGGHLPF
jgi:hypothetical protein